MIKIIDKTRQSFLKLLHDAAKERGFYEEIHDKKTESWIPKTWDNDVDAFRHITASALAVHKFGNKIAEEAGNWVETHRSLGRTSEVMDQYNNWVGREYERATSWIDKVYNPDIKTGTLTKSDTIFPNKKGAV